MRDYERAVEGVCESYGIRKSSVSRQWKAISTEKLRELVERPLGDLELVAIRSTSTHTGRKEVRRQGDRCKWKSRPFPA